MTRHPLYAAKRWIYRGDRPHRLAKVLNRVQAVVAARRSVATGEGRGELIALEVVGRSSGRPVTFPLVMATRNGEKYIASMLGNGAQWVRNVAAADGRAVLRSGPVSKPVHLELVPAADRPEILKAYLHAAPGARPHVPVDKDAPLAEFIRIASDHPVFRVHDSAVTS